MLNMGQPYIQQQQDPNLEVLPAEYQLGIFVKEFQSQL